MPELTSNPSILTKEQIKQELQRHEITMPPADSKKSVYVQMYRTHILHDGNEFSSDEEIVVPPDSPSKRNKKKPASPARRKPGKKPVTKEDIPLEVEESITLANGHQENGVHSNASQENGTENGTLEELEDQETVAMEIQNLTNDELAVRLRSMGQDIGPVVDSTRHVYMKKLDRLLRGEAWTSPVAPTAENEFSDNDEFDAQPVPEPASTVRTEVRQRVTETTRVASSVPHNITLDSGATGDASFSPEMLLTQVEEPPAPAQASGMSAWLKLILFAVVAFILFLVLMNMEPAGKSMIGEI